MFVIAHHDHIVAHDSQLTETVVAGVFPGLGDINRQHQVRFSRGHMELTDKLHIVLPAFLGDQLEIDVETVNAKGSGGFHQIGGKGLPGGIGGKQRLGVQLELIVDIVIH